MAVFPLVPIAIVGGSALAGYFGWQARGTVDQVSGNVSTASGALSTVQLVLYIGLIYAGYRFMKGLK